MVVESGVHKKEEEEEEEEGTYTTQLMVKMEELYNTNPLEFRRTYVWQGQVLVDKDENEVRRRGCRRTRWSSEVCDN